MNNNNLMEKMNNHPEMNTEYFNMLKKFDINVDSVNRIYDSITNILEVTRGTENIFCYALAETLTEIMVNDLKDHLSVNKDDLNDPNLMMAYSKLLALYNSYDRKLIKKHVKEYDIFKIKKEENKNNNKT